jgi:four helix bundle protein
MDYKDPRIWKGSMRLIMVVYDIADGLPREEMFGLRSQMTRAAVSIASNIAEGYERRSS